MSLFLCLSSYLWWHLLLPFPQEWNIPLVHNFHVKAGSTGLSHQKGQYLNDASFTQESRSTVLN